jgi:hypothetical protein
MGKVKVSKPVLSQADRQWEIDDALRTLQRAEAIKKDKFLMGSVKKSVNDLNKLMLGGSPKAPAKSVKRK